MKSKYLVRFLNRAAQFDADLELVDVFSVAVQKGNLNSSKKLFEYVDSNKHPRLSTRKVSSHNRQIALDHLKITLRAAFIKDIYEDVSAYLKELLAAAARFGLSGDRLIGEHKIQLEVNEVLACKNWPSVVNMIAEKLFRKLENQQSTIKLLYDIDRKLGLGVPNDAVQQALPYLEIRHLLVHADGIADESFCSKFPMIDAHPNTKIRLSYDLVHTARTSIVNMVTKYDECAVSKKILSRSDIQP